MSNILENLKEKLISYVSTKGNFVKKLKLIAEEIEEVKVSFDDVEQVKDLKQAYGQTLDNYGSNIGERRKGNTDNLYRLLIRIKIAENTSDATIDYIVQALALALDRDEKEINIEEGWNFIDEEQPASLYLSFPSEVFKDYNITYDRFIQLFNSVVAAGVSTDFFINEKDNIDIIATMPYTEFSTIPFADTIRTGQWTDQTTGEIYESIFQEEYSTKEQKLPFIGGFFSGNEDLDYPSAVIDVRRVLCSTNTYSKTLPYSGGLYSNGHQELSNQGVKYDSNLRLNSAYSIKDVSYNMSSQESYTNQSQGKEYLTDLITSFSHKFNEFNFTAEFHCGEVRL